MKKTKNDTESMNPEDKARRILLQDAAVAADGYARNLFFSTCSEYKMPQEVAKDIFDLAQSSGQMMIMAGISIDKDGGMIK